MAVLSDARFDFSDAYIISTGCAGSAMESTVMGDIFATAMKNNFAAGSAVIDAILAGSF